MTSLRDVHDAVGPSEQSIVKAWAIEAQYGFRTTARMSGNRTWPTVKPPVLTEP
jgi:hypothetical protein